MAARRRLQTDPDARLWRVPRVRHASISATSYISLQSPRLLVTVWKLTYIMTTVRRHLDHLPLFSNNYTSLKRVAVVEQVLHCNLVSVN